MSTGEPGIWKTKDGEGIPISLLSDSHLYNIKRYLNNKMENLIIASRFEQIEPSYFRMQYYSKYLTIISDEITKRRISDDSNRKVKGLINMK